MRFAACLFLAGVLCAQTSVERVLAELAAVRDFREAAISPDGARVAWVEAPQAHRTASVYLQELRNPAAKPRRVTAGLRDQICDEHGIAWSPDSARLAFLSDCQSKDQLQLYVAPASGGAPRKITSLKGYLAQPRWSPSDGKSLALLFTENAPRVGGPLEPVTPDAGVVEEKFYEQRIALVDPGSGAVRQISPADLYVYEYDWSPDGRRFAATAAQGAGDNNWWTARLYLISASGETEPLYQPPVQQQMASPRWSPEGASIAFIGGIMSDFLVTGGEIYSIRVSQPHGLPRNLTPDLKSSASSLLWLRSGKILFTETRDGGSGISQLDPATGQIERLWMGDESIIASDEAGISTGNTRETALIRRSWQQPPELWAGRIGDWRQITTANRDRKPLWGQARSIHWKSDDFTVQGWLLYPQNFDPNRRYPLVVSVHGGPASSKKPSWPGLSFDLALLSREGYFVLFPNPRGSYGQGERFTLANVKDFGGGDLRDIVAGVDEVLKTAPVDARRVGIGGWSYGGYMTMWAVTQSNRFHAAVAGAGIANWQSYYGENAIDQWMIPFFGASVYDDPAVYAKSSPITYIKQVKTPTLILVGDRDGECPPAQSYEFWHALKTLGVKTQMVIYPNEGHRIGKPEHRKDLLERTIRWFNENLR
jgi:dipeptidyl aminopeptidase/acylaminoacyl peptidase